MFDQTEPDPVVLDLLVEWEERATDGQPVTAEELCRDHPDRVAEVRRHLRRLSRVEGLLGVPAELPVGPPEVPGFELLREIGRGGMGVVYEARDLALGRVVAVKVPRPDRGGVVPAERFDREARTHARLGHPGIVTVHAGGTAGGRPFLVMDRAAGGSLAERMAAGRVRPAEAVALVGQVARAVGHAHAHGVVHRDLKPSNVLLTADGRPLVGDFGVAVFVSAECGAGSAECRDGQSGPVRVFGSEIRTPHSALRTPERLTRPGRAVGTAGYAAPELAGGRADPATPAADVWSLGVILFELLTGRLPFGDAPDPAGPWVVRWPVGRVGRRLRRVVGRCLSPDPAARYATADALADALDRCQRAAVVARLIGAAAVLATAVAGAAVWQARPADPAARHAERSREVQDLIGLGQPVGLIDAGGRAGTYRVRVGDGSARVAAGEGGAFVVESGPGQPVLVELLADPGTDRFRFSAEVRQDDGVGQTRVGLYYGERPAGPTDAVHLFGRLTFDDLGPGGPAPNYALHEYTYLVRRPAGWWWDSRLGGSLPHPAPPAADPPAGPWRRVEVVADRRAVATRFDGQPVGPNDGVADLDRVEAWARGERNGIPEMGAGWPVVDARGGLGLFVYGSRASFRNARVEPLP